MFFFGIFAMVRVYSDFSIGLDFKTIYIYYECYKLMRVVNLSEIALSYNLQMKIKQN